MNLDLTDDQRMLKDGVDRVLREHYRFEQRKAVLAEGGSSKAMWSRYAELGLLGLPFPSEWGGFGGGAAETAVVMESMGRALVVEPFLASVVLAGSALKHGASAAQANRLVPDMIEGGCVVAVALSAPSGLDVVDGISCTARRETEGWVLDGRVPLVMGGDCADWFVVPARTVGAGVDGGTRNFLFRSGEPGVGIERYRSLDRSGVADISFAGVRVPESEVLAGEVKGADLLERVVGDGIVAIAAEAVGCMDALLSLTTEHLKTRRQFGKPIGSFQALQHRAADMFVEIESSRSMSACAVAMVGAADTAARRRALSAVKARIGRAMRFVGQQAVQLHGAIGMTEEYPASHYFRKLTFLGLVFGDTEHHLSRLAESEKGL